MAMRSTVVLLGLLILGGLSSSAQARTPDREAILELVQGLAGRGGYPADLHVVHAERSDKGWRVEVGGRFDRDPVQAELRMETLGGALLGAGFEQGIELLGIEGISAERQAEPTPPKPVRREAIRPSPLRPRADGALRGRRIALVAGHGWLADGAGWRTQRSEYKFTGCGACRGITEDFFTAELVSQHIAPLLQNMGAEVLLVRDADLGHERQIVNDGGPGYSEEGPWAAGASAGGWAGDYRALAPDQNGLARFTAAFEEIGPRRVSVRWREGGNRTSAALVEIEHMGGTALIEIDQRRGGQIWLDLGTYVFGPGGQTVILRNVAGDGHLIADAVKFGGGVFDASQKPWWQMAAKSYIAEAGASAHVLGSGDVTIRPRYIESIGGADLYLSIHGNASGRPESGANGLSTYRYSCRQYPDYSRSEAAVGCDEPAGSRGLAEAVNAGMAARLHADWDPNYRDLGVLVANFGELRELSTTPGALIETGFFDNLENPRGDPAPRYADNRSMHDPRWRDALAYGIADGVAGWLVPGSAAPPPRPDGLFAQNRADGTLTVSWRAAAGATGYRVYTAREGRAWDDGVAVVGTSAQIEDLEPGAVYAFRVAGRSANGEGFASQAVAARFRGAVLVGSRPAEALIVSAYDRRDAWVQVQDNDLQYAVEHGHGLAAATSRDLYFDGALDEVVEADTVSLEDYALVDLAVGKDSTADLAVSLPMQGHLRRFVAAGGKVLLSGEEIGWQLVAQADGPGGATFLREIFGAAFVADDAEAFELRPSAAGPLAGLAAFQLDGGDDGVYAVRYPDVLAAAGEGRVALSWPDGTAGALYTPQTLLVGAPVEAIVPAASRARFFDAAVRHLLGDGVHGDRDLDGASDACEEAAGLAPLDARDGVLDLDGDGISNAEECQRGTDPNEATAEADADLAGDAGDELDAGLEVDAELVEVDAAEVDAAEPEQAAPDAEREGRADARAARRGGGDARLPPRTAVTGGGAGGGNAGCSAALSTPADSPVLLWLLTLLPIALRRRSA